MPEADPAVGALRLAHDWSAARGVPAHITILFPFADAPEVDEQAVADVVTAFPAFDFHLDRVGRFEGGAVWLHPEPSAPFAALTEAVWRRFPAYPPYEGAHDVVVPHLTVSDTPREIDVRLPIRARAREVVLIEEGADGRWSVRRRFPLQGVA